MAERKINLDDRKYDALKRVLTAQGRDIDEEIVARFEDLYNELVTEDELQSQAPNGNLGVYAIKDQTTMYFISSNIRTLYESAKCYGNLNRYGSELSLDSAIYSYFGEDGTTIIGENLFDILTKAMMNDERITVAAVYDMDNESVKVYGRDGVSAKHYTMDTFMDALESAELTLVQNGAEREKVLEKTLTGREYLTEPLLPMGYYAAKLTVCKAALEVLGTCLDYVSCQYTDPISDCLCDTKKGLSAVVDQQSLQDADAICPYLKEHLNHYTDQLWADGYLDYYGWDRNMLEKNIVCAIDQTEIQELARSCIADNSVEEDDEAPEMTM